MSDIPEWIEVMIELDALAWEWQSECPRGAHGYLHVADNQLVYIGVSITRDRALNRSGRTLSHRVRMSRNFNTEIRYVPHRTLAQAFEWEYWAINRAMEQGHNLENRLCGSAGSRARAEAYMAVYLPKTHERYMREKIKGAMLEAASEPENPS